LAAAWAKGRSLEEVQQMGQVLQRAVEAAEQAWKACTAEAADAVLQRVGLSAEEACKCLPGVDLRASGKYRATICAEGFQLNLGTCDKVVQAGEACRAAACILMLPG
jgi:hypothetical protein